MALGQQQRRGDAQVLGLSDGIGEVAADLPDLFELAPRQLELAPDDADLHPPPERQRPQRGIGCGFGDRDGPVGLGQRAVERPLLPIRDRQVVVAFGDALGHSSPLERGDGDLPGPDRFRVPPAQVADDPQIVGRAAGRGQIAVPAGDQQGLREVIRRFVDPPADKGDGAPRIEGVTLDRLVVPLARLLQRQIQPP